MKIEIGKTPWKIGHEIHAPGEIIDGSVRINDESGMLLAYVSDQNLKDKSLRDIIAKTIVDSVNNTDVGLYVVQTKTDSDNEVHIYGVYSDWKKLVEDVEKHKGLVGQTFLLDWEGVKNTVDGVFAHFGWVGQHGLNYRIEKQYLNG